MPNIDKKKFFLFDGENSETAFSDVLEKAYSAILNNNLLTALGIFESTESPRAAWGRSLISVLNGLFDTFPSYLQIRNFLEIDLDFLIQNEKIGYTEQLLGALELFIKINPETYKYAARVLFANKLYTAAFAYMEKAEQINYNDAELHFLFVKYYLAVNDYENAYRSVKECLKVIPDYYPAEIMKQKIEEILI